MKTRKKPEGMTSGPDKNCRDKSQYVADASTGSKEFMDEQLYQRALKGAFQAEFDLVKACIPQLAKYRTVPEFMKAMEKHKDLREKMVGLLEMIWKSDFARRPDAGVILMLAMRHNAVAAGDDYWGDYFIGLAETATTDCTDSTDGPDERGNICKR